MPGSRSEPGSGGESDSVPPKSSLKRLKNRSKVWERVPWFKKRNHSTDNVGATACASKAANSYISGQAVQGASVDSADLDYSPETSTSSFSPARSCSLFGSTSSGDLDAFEGCMAENDDIRRSKLYPNSEVIEQNCLRPSIARALFLQLDSWLSKKDGTNHSRTGTKYTWPKKKHTVDPSDDVTSGITRTVSMPGGMMRRTKCHCAACCSCTYRDKLEGMCSVNPRLNTSTTSLDTGLVMMGFSSEYNPLIRADSEPVDVAESAYGSNPNSDITKMSPSSTAKCNSLPTAGSMLAYKTCNMCGKLVSTNIPTKPTCSDSYESNLPSVSGSSAQMVLPELAFCQCHQTPNVNKSNKTTLPCQAHGMTAVCHNTTEVQVNSRNVLYQPKVGPSEFKERVDLIRHWFSEFSDDQKNLVLKQLLNDCDLPQLHLLSVEMEPRLHANCPPNCHDRLSWLPQALSLHIFSYLDPVSLCQASAVCHRWYQLTNDSSLWKHFCGQSKWRLSRAGESKQLLHHMTPDGIIQWKKVFADRYRLRNNWLRGRCNVRTFEGHTQGISCVQFDDTRIVSGSSDKTIKVWNIRTNNPWAVQTLVGHSGTVRCLHLDGNRLVSGSTDRTIKVWDLSTQQSWSSIACKVTMVGHTDTVRCLQVDEDKVISGSYDKTLKVWDIKTGQCRMTLRGHSAAVLCVQFDDTKIVSGSCDKTIKVWAFDGECMMTLQGHHDAVTCLQFDTTRIFSGSLDCNLKFWDINTGCCINTIDWKASEGHTGVVRCLQADSWRVVSASDDRTLKVWSLETGQRLVTLRNHTDGVTCLQFNDSIIVSGSYDKTVKLWDFSCC